MIIKSLSVLVVAFVSCVVFAADTYRWEDKEGRVYYSDQLPPTGARNIRRTRVDESGQEEELPYRLQVVVENSPVTLYVTQCGQPCDRAMKLLVQRGVPHSMLDASRADVQEQLLTLTGGEPEVPVVQIGETVLRGFEEQQWNSALDAAGYPSYAMIKVEPKKPGQGRQPATGETESSELSATGDDLESAEAQPDETADEDIEVETLESDEAEVADVNQNQ